MSTNLSNTIFCSKRLPLDVSDIHVSPTEETSKDYVLIKTRGYRD